MKHSPLMRAVVALPTIVIAASPWNFRRLHCKSRPLQPVMVKSLWNVHVTFAMLHDSSLRGLNTLSISILRCTAALAACTQTKRDHQMPACAWQQHCEKSLQYEYISFFRHRAKPIYISIMTILIKPSGWRRIGNKGLGSYILQAWSTDI